jgi:hypothetical protein
MVGSPNFIPSYGSKAFPINLSLREYKCSLKRPLFGIFLALVVLISIQSAYGYNVTYEKWDERIVGIPTVCIIEPNYPNSEILSETFASRLMDETRISVNEWMVQLQISERGRDKSMWEINQIPITLKEQSDFDYDKCTVFIKFKEKPESKDEYYKLLGKTSYELGNTGRSEITIYYAAIELCKTEDKKWIYFDPCYKDYPRLMQQLKSVIKHEFGHALGLGHFVADDFDVNVAWAKGNVAAPSIMAVFTHQNINNNFITPQDVVAVKSIYGEKGFLPKPEQLKVFDYFEPSSFVYSLPKGGFVVASVDGLLTKESYLSGMPVQITIKDPNNSITTKKIFPNSDGVFSYREVINNNTPIGDYSAYAEFRGVKSPQIGFHITNEEEFEPSDIPQWIKNSVRWWAEGKINDVDFILGIQYLVREGILNPPTREDQIDFEDDKTGIQIPKFVKQTSHWWVEGHIPDEQFIDAIQFMIKKGFIVI